MALSTHTHTHTHGQTQTHIQYYMFSTYNHKSKDQSSITILIIKWFYQWRGLYVLLLNDWILNGVVNNKKRTDQPKL